jgi:hypothetical protein
MGGDLLSAAAIMGRVCLGLVFLTASAHKLRHAAVFPAILANYRILPRGLAAPVARILPWGELALGLALLTQAAQPWAELAALLLLGAFAGAMAVNLRRGRAHIDCGCGQSALRQTLGWPLVGRNLGLALLAVPGLLATPRLSAAAPDTVVGVAAGAGVFVLYLLFNTLSALPALNRPVS